jgi:hypothetical protein
MEFPNRSLCQEVTRKYKQHYWYLDEETFFSLICSIRARRRGERRKLHVTADFAPALRACQIPEYHERGYVTAAADVFKLKGTLVKNGSSWSIYENRGSKTKVPKRPPR